MSFSRPIQWYHSHGDPIWPDDTNIGLDNKEIYIFLVGCTCNSCEDCVGSDNE